MQNILTIDLEEWFHANYNAAIFDNKRSYEVRVIQNTQRLLELFANYQATATFFVLGYIAEKHPELIREISQAGHEIATHGYSHELVYQQTPEEFRRDVTKSLELIEKAAQVKVLGYRAPSWSLTEQSLWVWKVLEDLGLKYDASVFPIKTYLYGLPSSQRFMYQPQYNNQVLNLLEIPSSTLRFLGRNWPFAGGFYFRVLPYRVIRLGLKSLNKKQLPGIVYLHPREIDPRQPRLKLNIKESLIHYYGIKGCENKLLRLLQEFVFTSISDFYQLGGHR
ncbi:MAG: XrtA system polysaccharide deacetylase [Desulfitobacteriaceae bacterium]